MKKAEQIHWRVKNNASEQSIYRELQLVFLTVNRITKSTESAFFTNLNMSARDKQKYERTSTDGHWPV